MSREQEELEASDGISFGIGSNGIDLSLAYLTVIYSILGALERAVGRIVAHV